MKPRPTIKLTLGVARTLYAPVRYERSPIAYTGAIVE